MGMDPHPDTVRHRARVQALMGELTWLLDVRAAEHDLSKTQSPEVEAFNAVTDQLAGLEYGSQEYKDALRDLGPALQHHYAHNRHHPEAHADGINGMTLLDLVELICDWKAASERHATGSMEQSLAVNAERFGISPQLARILANTVAAMGW
jgi:hypothetical protein